MKRVPMALGISEQQPCCNHGPRTFSSSSGTTFNLSRNLQPHTCTFYYDAG